ncbi:MAG TPA: hypothetical protein ENJ75_01680 [Candidatus Kaiserbacteria bacterium]|nr:hypothetical protein [Candidatus Kaiserbacteria bacterium]
MNQYIISRVQKSMLLAKTVVWGALGFILAIPYSFVHADAGLQLGVTGGNNSVQYGFGLSLGKILGIGGSSIGPGTNGVIGIGYTILGLINQVLVPLLFAVAFITFLWGVYKYFIAEGSSEDGQKKGKQLMLYGLIGFFVMVSLWGLVNVVADTFGLTGWAAPALPLSY